MTQALTKPISPEVMDALSLLVMNNGNVKRTAAQLGRARKTVQGWRDGHEDAYVDLCEKHNRQLEKRHIVKLNEVSLTATETALKAVREADRQLDAREDKVPAATAQRMMTVTGIADDKSLLWQGRPTQITETRDAEEILRALRAKLTIIDGEAEEE